MTSYIKVKKSVYDKRCQSNHTLNCRGVVSKCCNFLCIQQQRKIKICKDVWSRKKF